MFKMDLLLMIVPTVLMIVLNCINLLPQHHLRHQSIRITLDWFVTYILITSYNYISLIPKKSTDIILFNILASACYFIWVRISLHFRVAHEYHHELDEQARQESFDNEDRPQPHNLQELVKLISQHQKLPDDDNEFDDGSAFRKLRKKHHASYKFWSSVDLSIATAEIILVIAFFIIGINSFSHVRNSARSIPEHISVSKVAPTLHRGQTPVAIAPNTVFNKVSRAMSDVPNSNYYEIATTGGSKEIQAQYYHGRSVYIIPLQFRSVFKYLKARTIPGYFIINATDPNASPRFVHHQIKYSDSSYFGHNSKRLIYSHNHNQVLLSKNAQLEINDNGTPYYVETMFEPTSINTRPNFRRLRISLMNAQTGKVTNYRHLNQVPKFVDESLTSDVADLMDNYYGNYKYGWWNAQFSENGVKEPTDNGPEDGVTTVFDSHHNIHYLNDFTSTSKSSHSALGYSIINARNGKLTYYKTHGIMDTDSAKDNADRNYNAQKFHAEMPVLYEIDGHPTWVMSILDDSGLQRGFYFVDGSDPSIHADSSDSTSCLDAFRQALASGNASVHNSKGMPTKSVHGTVSREFVSSKNNEALIMLKGSHKIYTVNTVDYKKANLVRPGDNVSFKANINSTYGTVSDFEDNNM